MTRYRAIGIVPLMTAEIIVPGAKTIEMTSGGLMAEVQDPAGRPFLIYTLGPSFGFWAIPDMTKDDFLKQPSLALKSAFFEDTMHRLGATLYHFEETKQLDGGSFVQGT